MIAAMGIGIAMFPETGARLGNAFEGILNPQADDTASWRIEGWEKHLDRLTQNGNLLFGEGFGTYYGLYSDGGLVPSPHSAYVEVILKFGLFGLALYSILVFKFVRNALAVRKKLPVGPMRAWLEASILSFVAAHAYCSGYSVDPIMLVFFAVGSSAQRLTRLFPSSFEPVENKVFQRAQISHVLTTHDRAGITPVSTRNFRQSSYKLIE
jgi:O-antigen ligase